MSERIFRLVWGSTMLLALYFEMKPVLYGLIAFLIFEGLTNLRATLVLSRLRHVAVGSEASTSTHPFFHIDFEAERVLRLLVAVFLVISYLLYNDMLWVLPWFIGFALVGAGLSGICPMLMLLTKIGFR